jgi:hypothetical protein
MTPMVAVWLLLEDYEIVASLGSAIQLENLVGAVAFEPTNPSLVSKVCSVAGGCWKWPDMPSACGDRGWEWP